MKKIGVIGCCVGGFQAFYLSLMRYSLQKCNSQTPHICVDQPSLQDFFVAFDSDKTKPLTQLLLSSVHNLKKLEVDFVVIPNNSVHSVIKEVEAESPIPILNLLEIVSDECDLHSYKKVLVLGISTLLESRLYQKALQSRKIMSVLLSEEENLLLNREILSATISGTEKYTFSQDLEQIIRQKAQKNHCDAVLLACSDLVKTYHGFLSVPSIDPMELLARKTIDRALLI